MSLGEEKVENETPGQGIEESNRDPLKMEQCAYNETSLILSPKLAVKSSFKKTTKDLPKVLYFTFIKN